MWAENQEIKKHEEVIKPAVNDSLIEEKEATNVNNAKDSLEEIKNNANTKNRFQEKAEKIINENKEKISKGILDYFNKTPPSNTFTLDDEKINLLNNTKIIDAYMNLIDWINKNPEWDLNTIKTSLTQKKTEIEIKEKTETGTKQLQDILDVINPNESHADLLFWGNEKYRGARDALFTMFINEKGNSGTIKKWTQNPNELKFLHLVALWCGTSDNEISEITLNQTGATEYKESHIKVEITKGNNTTYKDILFTKTTDENYKKRSETFKQSERITKQKFQNNKPYPFAQAQIESLDTQWSYRSFKKLLNESIYDLKTLMSTDNFFSNIKEWNKGVDDPITKENGYYTVITDYVVEKTKNNLGDLSLLQTYLKNVNVQNVWYLWTDRTNQIINFNKLVVIIQDSKFPKDSEVGKEIIQNLRGIQTQLKPEVKWRKDALKDGTDGFFKIYGKSIVDILERFGGKWAVKKFFASIGMDAFYEKNFKSIEENINKIYKEKFELGEEQKTQINKITESKDNNNNFNGEAFDTNKNISDAIANFKKEKKDIFTTELKKSENITYLDPKLVHYLITKDFSNNKEITGKNPAIDDGEPLNINEFIYKDSSTNERKLNNNFLKNDNMQTKLLDRLWADQNTRNTIDWANQKIKGINIAWSWKTAEYSRQDLWKIWDTGRELYTIHSEKDIARFLAAYAFGWSKSLDYVITESELKNNYIPNNQEKVTEKKITFTNNADFDNNGLTETAKNKKIHEVIDVTNSPEKLQIVRGAETINIEKKTIHNVLTYAKEGENKRIAILKGDKIQEVRTQS